MSKKLGDDDEENVDDDDDDSKDVAMNRPWGVITQADEAEKERALQELEKQREREVTRWLWYVMWISKVKVSLKKFKWKLEQKWKWIWQPKWKWKGTPRI